jgi:hypothetical protein
VVFDCLPSKYKAMSSNPSTTPPQIKLREKEKNEREKKKKLDFTTPSFANVTKH